MKKPQEKELIKSSKALHSKIDAIMRITDELNKATLTNRLDLIELKELARRLAKEVDSLTDSVARLRVELANYYNAVMAEKNRENLLHRVVRRLLRHA